MNWFRRLLGQTSEAGQQSDVNSNNSAESESQDDPLERKETTAEIPVIVEEPEETEPFMNGGATRPLPLETVISSRNEHLIFGQSTDVGMVRSNNQDAVLSFFHTSRSSEEHPDFGLFVVADGMGGHHDGEKASAMTVHIVASYVTSHIYLPLVNGGTDDFPPITETLVQAVQQANSDVIERVPEGGTTLTAVAVVADLAYVVHVGDSRAYLITKDGLDQITRDHSLVQRLIELGRLTEEEAADHPQKNVLYRAIGQNETLEVDAVTRRLPPNSRVLICSDGLWNLVDDKEIGEIVMSHDYPQEACDKLVALANTRGGADNITTLLLQVPSS